jgi:hypothetical protein
MVIFAGCSVSQNGNQDGASIELSISENMKALTIVPDVDMTIRQYNIRGEGDSGDSFSQTVGGTETGVLITGLDRGIWTITIDAVNPDGYIIGQGSADNQILNAGETLTVTIEVTPLPGPGAINIVITWPDGVVFNPQVDATLTEIATGITNSIDFVEDAVANEAVFSPAQTFEAGYYSLSVQLNDGTLLVWGGFEAVRVLAGWMTDGAFDLDNGDINPAPGDIDIIIDPNLKDPIQITLDPTSVTLERGQEQLVTSTPDPVDTDPDFDYLYQWYVDGSLVDGATLPDFNIVANDYTLGSHRLDVAITYKDTVSSNFMQFEVVEPVLTYDIDVTVEDGVHDYSGLASLPVPIFLTSFTPGVSVAPAGGTPIEVETLAGTFPDLPLATPNTGTYTLTNAAAGYADGTYPISVLIDPDGDGIDQTAGKDYFAVGEATVSGANASVTIFGPWGTYNSLIFSAVGVTPPIDANLHSMYVILVADNDTWGDFAYARSDAAGDASAVALDFWGPSNTVYDLHAFIDMNDSYDGSTVTGPDSGDYVFTQENILFLGSFPVINLSTWTLVP